MEKVAMCIHPICPTKEGCEHCSPHPYNEEECNNVCCGMLEEPSCCEIVSIIGDNGSVTTIKDTTNIRQSDYQY